MAKPDSISGVAKNNMPSISSKLSLQSMRLKCKNFFSVSGIASSFMSSLTISGVFLYFSFRDTNPGMRSGMGVNPV